VPAEDGAINRLGIAPCGFGLALANTYSVSILVSGISSSLEVIPTFVLGKHLADVAECVEEVGEGSGPNSAQVGLELGESLFDWVQIWRIWRQEKEPTSSLLEGLCRRYLKWPFFPPFTVSGLIRATPNFGTVEALRVGHPAGLPHAIVRRDGRHVGIYEICG
jgi:hypothetical protein